MKTRKILKIVFTVLAAGMTIFSGVMKLTGGQEMKETLGHVGVAEYINLLGLMEISFAALFIFPQTMRIGFILLSCYFAGALATELSHGTALNAFTPIILVWIAAFLRDRSLFLPGKEAIAAY